jgi:DNA topoisomerase-2
MSVASDYTELTQREHVLKRPELFMGNTEVVRWDRPEWVISDPSQFPQNVVVKQRMLTGSDALVRIWIEPFSNAIDSVFRSNSTITHTKSKKASTPPTDTTPISKAKATFISVMFDPETQQMTVENDGWGIPLEFHASITPPVMVPTMIFSRYSTSSNYNDLEERITSGLNGLGSKLTNTMSNKFAVECRTCALKVKKHPWQIFRQAWSNNMSLAGEVEMYDEEKPTGVQPGYGTVKVSWIPDWSRFGGEQNVSSSSSSRAQPRPYPGYLPDELAYIQRLVLDCAMQMTRYNVRVLWNHQVVQVAGLLDYARIFVPLSEEQRRLEQESRVEIKSDESESIEQSEHEIEQESDPSTETQSTSDSVNTSSDTTPSLPLWKQSIHMETPDCEIVVLPMISAELGGPVLVKPRDPLVISFVNGIYTAEGGIHVTAWEKDLFKPLLTKLKLTLEVRDIRRYFAVFVNAFRVNKPKFSTQSKTKLIDSGSLITVKVGKNVIVQLSKWTVVDLIRAEDLARNRGLLDKFAGKSTSSKDVDLLDDFEDANFARIPSKRHLCVLVGCEGKSASAFVKNALNAPPPAHLLCIPSKDYVGLCPFKGKGLNVTNSSVHKLAQNKEVQTIIRILGLRTDLDYRDPINRRTLRYGKFLMIGDADLDGFHIVSLLYNFFATLYPTLLQNVEEPFFFFLRTPIITLRPSNSRSNENELHLYSWLHAHAYLDQLYSDSDKQEHVRSKWKVVYRKGLGVWNEREPKVEVGRRPVHLYWMEPSVLPKYGGGQQPMMIEEVKEQVPNPTPTNESNESKELIIDQSIDQQTVLAREFLIQVFHKDNAEFRRKWLDDYIKTRRSLAKTVVNEVDPSITTPDYEVSQQSIKDFLSQELILFNEASCGRNLPRRDDGLKQSQRKILFSAIVKPLPFTMADPLKVSQFSGYVAETTQYHYGDKSLNDAIIKLAQSYVGSNNIPLLYPEGNFGSRDDMGKDAAACRYIHTKMHIMTRLLFREEDDAYLPNEFEDGHPVEKREYVPILPMLLVNGASGMGTGYATKIPPHNPVLLADWIRVWLERKTHPNTVVPDYPELCPWWRGFKGTVQTTSQLNKFMIWGVISRLPAPNVLSKTETCIQIHEIPLGMKSISIKEYRKRLNKMRSDGKIDFVDHSDSYYIDFKVLIKTSTVKVDTSSDEDLMLFLKLRSWFSSRLVCLTDTPTDIVRYNSVNEILEAYCERRLELFETVRQGQIQKTLNQIEVEQNRRRFVQAVVDKTIVPNDYEDDGLESKLTEMQFRVDPDKGKGYQYLLEMSIRSLTLTRVRQLDDKIAKLQTKLAELRASTPSGIWKSCLDTWQSTWTRWLEEEAELNEQSRKKKGQSQVSGRSNSAHKAGKSSSSKRVK